MAPRLNVQLGAPGPHGPVPLAARSPGVYTGAWDFVPVFEGSEYVIIKRVAFSPSLSTYAVMYTPKPSSTSEGQLVSYIGQITFLLMVSFARH